MRRAGKAWVKQDSQDTGSWVTKRPNYPLKRNGSVTYFTAGGGGYGPVGERSLELTERDQRLGYVDATNGVIKYERPTRIENRTAKVRQAMREKGLQTLLVFDSGRHNFLRMNYVAYLTDFISVGPETMLMLPLEDEPTLFLSPAWDMDRAKEESWVKKVQPVNDLWNRLGNHMGKAGLIGRRR